MKRFLLLFLFVVNLQIVVQNRSISICIFTEAYAQHMTKEEHDNCYEEGYGWYLSPFSDCRDIIVTCYKCSYCGAAFDYPSDRSLHEKTCPQNPNVKKEEEQPSNPENNNGTGNSGGGTSGGGSTGGGGTTGGGTSGGGSIPSGSTTAKGRAVNNVVSKFKQSIYNRGYDPDKCGWCLRGWKTIWQKAGIGEYSGCGRAKDFGPYLLKYGFKEIPITWNLHKEPTKDQYSPRVGDTRVWDTYPDQETPSGHIDWWNGTQWVSDYKENHWFPGKGYKKYPKYKIYR